MKSFGKKYAISQRKNVIVPEDANTTKGNYPVLSFKAFRKFDTREQAREFKRKDKRQLSIINLETMEVVR